MKTIGAYIEDFVDELALRFQLPPARPTDNQLATIVGDATIATRPRGRALTEQEWARIVYATIRFRAEWIYEGPGFAEINALFIQIRQRAEDRRR